MIGKLMLAVSAILLTALVGLVLAQQKTEQHPGNSEQKAIKVRAGEVLSVDAIKNEINIKDDAGVETRLLVGASTKITREGKSITLADVKVGELVSSECAESSDGCKAKSIKVSPPPPSN